MKMDHHKISPETIHALLAKLEMLEPEQVSAISNLIDLLRTKKITLRSYDEWTDEDFQRLAALAFQSMDEEEGDGDLYAPH
jgi:hypothetical protein